MANSFKNYKTHNVISVATAALNKPLLIRASILKFRRTEVITLIGSNDQSRPDSRDCFTHP